MATRRRRPYSPEERAARDAADNAINAEGQALLADPAAVAALVARLATLPAPSMVCRYSLRNHALLDRQAAARGMTLTDVGSVKDWNLRGRSIRKGETGLRIVAPKGREQATTSADDAITEAPEPEHGPEHQDNSDGEGAARTRFRMVPVFDISQTIGIEDFEGEPLIVEPVADPVAALRDSLTAQLERVGYQIITGAAPAVDHATRTVTTSDIPTVDELAQALAAIATLPADQRPTYRPEPRPEPAPEPAAPADPARVRLDLGKYADAHARIRTDYTTGRSFYTVTGPRVSGTFTVVPQFPTESDHVHMLTIDYGEHDGTRSYDYRFRRPDRPVINGIDLVGGSGGFDAATVEQITARNVHCRRTLGPHHDAEVPARTRERTAAVIRAILCHYMTRDDLPALHRAAAAIEARNLRRQQEQGAAQLTARISELEAERAERAAAAHRYADIADDTEQLAFTV